MGWLWPDRWAWVGSVTLTARNPAETVRNGMPQPRPDAVSQATIAVAYPVRIRECVPNGLL